MRKTGTFIVEPATLVEQHGMSPERAARKHQSTRAGWLAALLGVLLLLAALGIVLTIVRAGGDIGLITGTLIGGFGAVGFVLFGLGMTLVSRDASPAIDAAGSMLERIIRAFRGG